MLDRELLSTILDAALDALHERIPHSDYCLVGTAACLLHGVALPARDVDILVRKRIDVDRFAEALAGFSVLTPPSELGVQYYFECEIAGIGFGVSTVEVDPNSEFVETMGAGPWHYSSLTLCGRHQIRIVDLELRLATELLRGREDRYEPIVEWFQAHAVSCGVLHAAMTARSLSPSRINSVLQRVGCVAET